MATLGTLTEIAEAITSTDVAKARKAEIDAEAELKKTEIEETGAEVLASIPEDYTELTADVNQIKTGLSTTDRSLDALWKLNEGMTYEFEEQTESGTNVPPIGAKFESVEEVYGKSTQDTTNGYQLIEYDFRNHDDTKVEMPYTQKGITYTLLDDGGIKVKGTCTLSSGIINFKLLASDGMVLDSSTTYTLSVKGATSSCKYVAFGSNSGATIKSISTDYSYQVTGAVTNGHSVIQISAGDTVDTIIYVMLESGSTAHSFEKYTGGIASPNPDYPQEITDVTEENFVIRDADGNETTYQMNYTLRSVGDVHDVLSEDGIVRNIYAEVWDENTSFSKWGNIAGVFIHVNSKYGLEIPSYSDIPKNIVSSIITKATRKSIAEKTSIGIGIADTVTTVIFMGTDYDTVDKIHTYLASNPAVFHCLIAEPTTESISTEDAAFLQSLEVITADHTITITDQDGNDISYLVEYITKLSEVSGT